MKKIFIFLALLLTSIFMVSCNKGNGKENPPEKPNVPDTNLPDDKEPNEVKDIEKHLILDAEGNYGGSLNSSLYGEGAPLNGELDYLDSPYYLVNDFYNMESTKDRTIFTGFEPYQQTMKDTSGIASALMILNYFGEDVYEQYTELNLMEKYEDLNHQEVYGNGTDAAGLKKLFNDIGYTAVAGGYINIGSNRNDQIESFTKWVMNHLDNGRFVMLRYQDNIDFEWNVVIGLDTMGTTNNKRDKVLIMGTPNDNFDHFQDGYTISTSGRVFRWWQDVAKSGDFTDQFDCLVVYPKTPRIINRVEEERVITQVVPERHLILNADGSFGGSTNAALYGSVSFKNGEADVLYSNYFKFIDYYNMEGTETRLLLPQYRAYEQTMSSSCGISTTLAALNYYGVDTSIYDEVFLVEKYQELNNSIIYNVGVGSNGLKKLVEYLGFRGEAKSYSQANYVNESSMIFSTYESFVTWVKGHLSQNRPLPVSWRPHGGHWQAIIGYDDMGTESIYDDVIVLADSSDTWDHYQDGYNTYPATLFYNQWYNGSFTYNQQHIIIYFD